MSGGPKRQLKTDLSNVVNGGINFTNPKLIKTNKKDTGLISFREAT
jgi:hypothetical protein